MSKRRKFSPEFKSQIVLQLLTGEKSMAELCRAHQLSSQMIGNWKLQFLAAAPRAFEKDSESSTEQDRIADLERIPISMSFGDCERLDDLVFVMGLPLFGKVGHYLQHQMVG